MNTRTAPDRQQPPREVLRISKVVKRFGKKVAVNDVSLSVCAGDIYGFIGHNGAGKTTLIRSIVGVSPLDGGDIHISGHSVRTEPIRCKEITAYVPDSPDIYDFLTGIQYLNYLADLFGVAADVRRERIEAYATRLALAPVLGDLISSYSHGMKQKLVLIGALIHKPELLVLDEPFVGLDPEASYQLKEMMREFTAQGAAIFFSSHVLEVVEKLCGKVAIISDGALVAAGRTEDIIGNESLEEVFLGLRK